jgi:hypothetical protein
VALDLALLKAAEAKDAYDGLATKVQETERAFNGAGMGALGLAQSAALVATAPMVEQFANTNRELLIMRDRIADLRDNQLASFVEQAAAGFGTIAVQGGNAGQMLAKTTLQSIGQMATSLGKMFILSGIAAKALPFMGLKGPAAIGAGIGLVALGAGLGAAAGNVGGGGGGGGGGPTGVGESFENTISRPSVTRMDYAGMIVISEDEKTVNRLTRMTDRSREMGVTRNAL